MAASPSRPIVVSSFFPSLLVSAGLLHLLASSFVQAYVPTWPATYQMNKSTILMVCNYSGYTDPQTVKGWSILSFDWSNAKALWAQAKPMNCEEDLVTQVNMINQVSPDTVTFVYRNAVKALPWHTSVRLKLNDPAYAPWFLKFANGTNGTYHVPVCDNNYNPPLCSALYHDQSQTPGYPSGDGNCAAPACDVGNVPVGEYLFDFRAVNTSVNGQTFLDWYINDYFFGPAGAGNNLVAGFYIDDSWGPGGPTEMEGHCVEDMGLSQDEVNDITANYLYATTQLYNTIINRQKFVWDMFLNIDPYAPLNGDCPQPWVRQATCATDLRKLCNASSPVLQRAWLYGFSPGSCTGTDPANLVDLNQDVANFLLGRGDYAYLGNGWLGCSRTYEYPAEQFDADYGSPIDPICYETEPGSSGIFIRNYTHSTVQMDCNTWTPTITFH